MIVRYKEPKTGIEVFFGEGVFQSIERYALKFVPYEFGGILSGFTLGKSIFIMDTKVPDKFKASVSGFTRHPDILNQYLKRIYDVTDGWLDYLGEWHSHPLSEPNFSENDRKSMIDISQSSSVNKKTPLLLIVSFQKKVMDRRLYLVNGKDLLQADLLETI